MNEIKITNYREFYEYQDIVKDQLKRIKSIDEQINDLNTAKQKLYGNINVIQEAQNKFLNEMAERK